METRGPSPLENLAEASGRSFPNLFKARARTSEGLAKRRAELESLPHGDEASIVLMGSWGRSEVTSESDDDFMVLIHGPEGSLVKPGVEEVSEVLDHQPSKEGPFAAPVFSEKLVQHIGLDPDDNKNLTGRMLFLLESVSLTGVDVYVKVRDEVLGRYFDDSIKPYRPPRFLLNDLVRYWRTICVDFAAKEWEGPEKWGLRNAKLRTSRKILFAGGLLPTLECSRFDSAPMRSYLEEQLALSPTDRIAQAFLKNRAIDEGARTLGAYDEFVGRMNESAFREDLQAVSRENAGESVAFAEASAIGRELEAGLLALLHEAPTELPRLVRDYAIF
jgi:hypothetical protein